MCGMEIYGPRGDNHAPTETYGVNAGYALSGLH